MRPPFPPIADAGAHPGFDPRPLLEDVRRKRVVGVILVRLGGYATGVFAGRRLVASKIGHAVPRNRPRRKPDVGALARPDDGGQERVRGAAQYVQPGVRHCEQALDHERHERAQPRIVKHGRERASVAAEHDRVEVAAVLEQHVGGGRERLARLALAPSLELSGWPGCSAKRRG